MKKYLFFFILIYSSLYSNNFKIEYNENYHKEIDISKIKQQIKTIKQENKLAHNIRLSIKKFKTNKENNNLGDLRTIVISPFKNKDIAKKYLKNFFIQLPFSDKLIKEEEIIVKTFNKKKIKEQPKKNIICQKEISNHFQDLKSYIKKEFQEYMSISKKQYKELLQQIKLLNRKIEVLENKELEKNAIIVKDPYKKKLSILQEPI